MSALSVGLFTYSTLPRGSVVHTACLAEALGDAGCDVTVYALDKDGRGFFRPLRVRLRLVPASTTPASTAELVRVRAAELGDYLRRYGERHDVHHAEDCLTANGLLDHRSRVERARLSESVERARLSESAHRIDVVRTVHHVESFADRYLARCQERSIREPALCLAVSEAVEQDVLRSFGVRAARAGNGVSVERFAEVEARRTAAWADKLGLGQGPVVLGVGGVEERKNTVRVLRAFARVRETHPRAELWILGGATVLDHGAYRAAFEQELRALPEDTRRAVSELGIVHDEDVPALFRLASVLAFPSLHEGFGLSALEALASGLPLVASRRPPLTEFLDDSCATLVDPLSSEDIARGILEALAAPPLVRQLVRRRGRLRARAYSWRNVAALHLDAYRRLRETSPPRRTDANDAARTLGTNERTKE